MMYKYENQPGTTRVNDERSSEHDPMTVKDVMDHAYEGSFFEETEDNTLFQVVQVAAGVFAAIAQPEGNRIWDEASNPDDIPVKGPYRAIITVSNLP